MESSSKKTSCTVLSSSSSIINNNNNIRISHFSALAGKYSPILGLSNQQD